MNFKLNFNTEIELNTINDLNNLRLVMEVNGLDKPNFSELARNLGVDRRTVKKYYEGNIEINRKPKKSKIDDYYDLISSLLSEENKQIFCYKSHLYRYLVREYNLECSRNNFNYYILKNNEFAEYFKPKRKKDTIKSETPFGKQVQFNWKEKLNFTFKVSVVDALFELTAKELEVNNFNATNVMVKVAGFPHLKEMKDFDFEFQPKINNNF